MSLLPTKKHEELEIRSLSGEYNEVIDEINVLLKMEMEEVNKIAFLIIKSNCLFNLKEIKGDKKCIEEGFVTISEAYERSEKLAIDNLILISGSWKVWFFAWIGKPKEAIELFDYLQNLMTEADKTQSKYDSITKAMIKHVEPYRNFLHDRLNNQPHDIHETIRLRKEALSFLENDDCLKSIFRTDLLFFLNITLGAHHNQIGDREQSLFFYNEALNIALEYTNEIAQCEINTTIASIYRDQGKIKEFIDLTLEIITTKERIGGIKSLTINYIALGVYYYHIGEMKKFLEYTLKAYNIVSDNGTKDTSRYLDNLGLAYVSVGELEKALETFKKSNEISKKENWEWGIYSSQENLGHVYYLKGELDKAIELQEESRDFFVKRMEEVRDLYFINQFKGHLANNQYMIHHSYLKKGQVNKAIQALIKALTLYRELNSPLQVVNVLFLLINILSNHNMEDQARIYFDELKESLEELDIPKIKRLQLLAEGVMLKSSSDSRNRVKAEVIFAQLLNEELGFHLEIETLFNQCDLLLSELRKTGNKNVLSNLQEYIEKLIKISNKNNLVGLLIESLWFKAQLVLLEGNYDEARSILAQASNLAEEKGYYQLALKVNSSKDEIFEKLLETEQDEMTTLSLADKMDIIGIEDSFEEIKDTQVFDIADMKFKVDF